MNNTNTERARRGCTLVLAHRGLLGEGSDGDDPAELASALADLRHFAKQKGWNWDAIVDLALFHFEEEQAGCDNYLDEEE